MLISRQNLSVIIVSFKSDHVIHHCINSIDKEIEIIIIDNSNNIDFKNDIENRYKNVSCILSRENIGMGAGNNLGIKNTNKDFVLILNPDVILEKNTISEIISASKKLDNFAIIAPISDKKNYPNYKLHKNESNKFNKSDPFKVKTVDGYSMLLNLKRLKNLGNFDFLMKIFFYILKMMIFVKD
jgi:N-acetylglucosaminyl-diphospho-decaprenol L-rhamnosyltransferase